MIIDTRSSAVRNISMRRWQSDSSPVGSEKLCAVAPICTGMATVRITREHSFGSAFVVCPVGVRPTTSFELFSASSSRLVNQPPTKFGYSAPCLQVLGRNPTFGDQEPTWLSGRSLAVTVLRFPAIRVRPELFRCGPGRLHPPETTGRSLAQSHLHRGSEHRRIA